MGDRREWWIRITDSPCDLAIPPGEILDDYLKSGVELVHVRNVLPLEDQVQVCYDELRDEYSELRQRYAKLVDAAFAVVKDTDNWRVVSPQNPKSEVSDE